MNTRALREAGSGERAECLLHRVAPPVRPRRSRWPVSNRSSSIDSIASTDGRICLSCTARLRPPIAPTTLSRHRVRSSVYSTVIPVPSFRRSCSATSSLYRARGPEPFELLRIALEGEINLATSQPIIDETLEVLERKFGIPAEALPAYEAVIRQAARTVKPAVHALEKSASKHGSGGDSIALSECRIYHAVSA